MTKDVNIHLRTTEEIRKLVAKLAAEENRSVTSYIEQLIRKAARKDK